MQETIFSSPDIYVQVQRRDSEILRLFRGEENRLSVLGERHSSLDEEKEMLRVKKRNSKGEPGEPYSPTRMRRLADLSNLLGGFVQRDIGTERVQWVRYL